MRALLLTQTAPLHLFCVCNSTVARQCSSSAYGMRTYICARMHTYAHVCAYVRICAYIHVRICAYVHDIVHVCVHAYIRCTYTAALACNCLPVARAHLRASNNNHNKKKPPSSRYWDSNPGLRQVSMHTRRKYPYIRRSVGFFAARDRISYRLDGCL